MKLISLRKANEEEVKEIARKLWNTEKMQNYILKTYDFYITKEGLWLELEKVSKLSINKTMWYDDETEGPEVNESNFIAYNNCNMPNRNLENYLEEVKNLKTKGCASGRYDYKGIYFVGTRTDVDNLVTINWFSEDYNQRPHFKRYLTAEEQQDYINLVEYRKNAYIERLKKYYKRYCQNIHAIGYWVNR